MLRISFWPTLALLLAAWHAVNWWRSENSSVYPTSILPPDPEVIAAEIDMLRAERGSVLDGSLLGKVEPATYESPAKIAEDAAIPPRELIRQLRRTADQLEQSLGERGDTH